MATDDVQEQLAVALIELGDRIRKLVEPLTDEELRAQITICEAEGRPGETHNFEMPMWTHVAELLTAELGMRVMMRDADEYMKRTGEKTYCPHCGGACNPKNHE